jgi:multidrug efflux pump subunit AcrA (membrane-fusion protein)
MFYGKIAKLTFSALLLAAGSAYAQDVTLNDGTTKVSWSEFIKAINDPTSIKGTVSEIVQKTYDDAKAAYDEVVAGYNDKVAAQTAAQTNYNAAVKTQSEKAAALRTANADFRKAEETLAGMNKTLTDLKSEYESLERDLNEAKENGVKERVGWLQTAFSNAKLFSEDYDSGDESSSAVAYYKETIGTGFGKPKTLYVSFNPSSLNDGYTEIGLMAFYDKYMSESATAPKFLKVYFGKTGNTYNYTDGVDGVMSVTSYTGGKDYIIQQAFGAIDNIKDLDKYQVLNNQTTINDLRSQMTAKNKAINDQNTSIATYTEGEYTTKKNAVTAAENEKDAADADVETKLNILNDANSAVTTAQGTYNTATNEFRAAETTYNNAVAQASTDAQANYQDVTLNADVTTSETIKGMFSGVIVGNGHVINIEGTAPFCRTFNGQMANVAVNGQIYSALGANASYTNVANWDGSKGAFVDDDKNRTTYDTLGKLGFAARSAFGVDFSGNKLVTLTDESKVYSITEYQANSTTQQYVQTRDENGFFTENRQTYSIPANVFVESATADLIGYDNVIIDGKCENVVIEDKTAFYCPMDITAANVTYGRSFKDGFSAVCLPFPVKGDDNITVSRFDKEAVGKIWFKKVSDEVPANTPLLIAAKNAFTFDLHNVTIKKTLETQMVEDEGDLDEPSKGYGLFKAANREEFQGGATEPHKVYGLSGGVFKPVSEKAVLPAFRMVVYSATAQPTGPSAAPRRIAIVDEMGNDITDELTSGIESVGADNDASSFSVIPGTGKIDITSEAELGNVAIYTIDGKLAAMTNVVVGTTTVELQQGIYIVMGKKVMVK